MESILEVLTPDNLVFIFKGFGLTLYISLIAIVLATLIGTVLAVMRNGKNPILRIISSIYIEFVRNVPNLLWISPSFGFQDEIHTSRNHCIYPLYLSSLG